MQNKKKILIGDMSDAFGIILYSMLNEFGVEVLLSPKDGWEVHNYILQEHPDVVVMEESMPCFDAIGVMRSVSSVCEQTPAYIVIGSTDSDEAEQNLLHHGASHYMLKPFDLNVLISYIVSLANLQPEPVVATRSPSIDELVHEMLDELHMPTHLKGYTYLLDAIPLTLKGNYRFGDITNCVYPVIAKKYDTTVVCVERSISRTVLVTWGKSDPTLIDQYFPVDQDGKRNNGGARFILRVCNILETRLKKRSKYFG